MGRGGRIAARRVSVDLWESYLERRMSGTHEHGHHHPTPPSPVEARAAALEEMLTEKGLVNGEFIDAIVSAYAERHRADERRQGGRARLGR